MNTVIVEDGPRLRELLQDRSRAMTVSPVGWRDCRGWTIRAGAISHESGGFFDVTGVEYQDTGEQFLLLQQRQSAVTALLTHERAHDILYLVQARQEPGNLLSVQLAPTVQSTPANYLAVHGGRRSSYIDSVLGYSSSISAIVDTYQLDLASRYLRKSKRVLFLRSDELLPTEESFAWIPGASLVEWACESALLNADLRALLAVSPWSAGDPADGLVPASPLVRDSLTQPVRSDVAGSLLASIDPAAVRPVRNVALDRLRNWTFTADALSEIDPCQCFDVRFYSVSAPDREVRTWSQPLIDSHGEGEVILEYRISRGVLEVGVRVAREPGLAGAGVLQPSSVVYPGLRGVLSAAAGTRSDGSVETTECDEGGRFMQDVSRYRVAPHDAGPNAEAGSTHWLRVSELKWILSHPMVASMQLRVVTSHLLALRA
ncbi:MAG TPA: NDP-hexose 2,3-dehydratase family protein [Vicinamibacteria bacterium]|nr:NDP-hexose 2,3-dehydratase family protein [Vicinamibacteria bacterium]